MKLKMFKSAVAVMITMFFASLCQAQPGIVTSQGLNWWGGGASGTPSMSLSSGGQLYVYGATTGGAAPMSAFANGQTIQITNANGNVSAVLAVTTDNGNSYTTGTSYDAFGGVGVSGFNYAQGFCGFNPGPGPNLQASVTFTLSAPALVVVMGMGSSQATLSLSGLDNPTVDVSEVSGVYEPALKSEHEYLQAGTYTVQVTTGDGGYYYQTPQNEVDLIGVLIFSTSPNVASSSSPTIPIPAAFQPPPSVTLTISACQGGAVSFQSAYGDGYVAEGQSTPLVLPSGSPVTLEAHISADNAQFSSWSPSSGITVVSGNTASSPIKITVNSDSQIAADFSPASNQHLYYSGYFVAVPDPNGANGGYQTNVVSDVKGTWQVPTVQTVPNTDGQSSTWIGIAGNGGSALVQIGTAQNWFLGSPQYYAWYEVIDPQQLFPIQIKLYPFFSVSAGDTISAEVTYLGQTSYGQNTYALTINDITQGESHTEYKNSNVSESQQIAEWIVEDPAHNNPPQSAADLFPFANFGTVNFSGCYANINSAKVPIISAGTYPVALTMTSNGNSDGTTEAAPSPLSCDGTSFSVTYQPQTVTGTTFAFNISDSPSDGGTDGGNFNVYSNDTVTVTAMPNSCFSFENWTENGVYLTNSPTCTITVTNNVNLTANFVTNIYTVTASSSPSDGGTVTGAATVDCGDSVTLTATANTEYSFTGWTWNGNLITNVSPFTFTAIANSNLVANFVPLGSSTITTLVSPPSAGSTTGGGTYTNEATATITATAAQCYAFLYWTTNGVPFSFSPTNMISVTTNEVFAANFAAISYNIDASASAGGTASGGGPYNCGNAVTLLATPNPCYSFVNWTENGSPVSSLSAFYFVVDTNHNFVANFVPTTSTVSTASSPANAGTTSGGGAFDCEFSVPITAAANSGWAFANWTENGVIINTSSNFTFTGSGNQSLVANFVPNVQLGFGSPVWSAGNLNLMLQGPVSSNYEVDASTDLSIWLPYTNFVLTSSPWYFSIPPATNTNQGFYRAAMQ